MFDFSEAIQEGIFTGLLSGFNILWQSLRANPWVLLLLAFVLFGNAALKKMNKHHRH